MIAMTMFGHSLSKYTAGIESDATHHSLQTAEELLAKGENVRVQQAIHAYNQTASTTRSTYKASFGMSYVLYHGPRP